MLSTKIEGISWIITLDRDRRIIRDGTILIEDGKISGIGASDAFRSAKADVVISGNGKLVAPGFIDCHAHLSYGHSMRGLIPDTTPHPEYLRRVFRFQRAMKPEEEYHTALLAITELLKNGCTSLLEPGLVNDVNSVVRAVTATGIRAVIGRSFADMESSIGMHLTETDEAIRQTRWILTSYGGNRKRVRAWIMPFSPDCCSDEFLHSASEMAERYDAGITTHCSRRRESAGLQIARLGSAGALGERMLLAHPIFADDRELELIASTDTRAVFCPSSSTRSSGPGAAGVVPKMLNSGITVGLGSDSASSSCHLDMIRSMHLLSLLSADAGQGRPTLSPDQVLEMGTIFGARALRMENEVGSLSTGKSADLLIFNTTTPQWTALFNPVSSLINSSDGRSIERVMIGGETVVENGHVTTIDESELCTKVQEIGENVAGRLGISPQGLWPED